MWNGTPDCIGAEVGRAAGEVVIHTGKAHAGIDGHRAGTELEVEVCGPVEFAWVRTGGRDLHKHIVVDENAVLVLACRVTVFLECLESSDFARLCFERGLLLGGKLSCLSRKVGTHRRGRRAPLEGELRAFVRPESVVI